MGEIVYLLGEAKGLIIGNILLLLSAAALLGAAFKNAGKFHAKLSCRAVYMCLLMLVYMDIGYYFTSSYDGEISKVENISDTDNVQTISGTVQNIVKKKNCMYCYVKDVVFDAKSEAGIKSKTGIKSGQVLLIIKEETQDNKIIPGNIIYAGVMYEEFKIAKNEGGFDEKSYYHSIGVIGKYSVSYYKMKRSKDFSNQITEKLFYIKQNLCRRIEKLSSGHDSSENYAGIYKAILFGEKDSVSENTKELYKMSGILHMLSISGLHVSLIGYFIYKLMRKFRGILFSFCISVIIIYLYALMTGYGFSTKRAVIMFTVHILSDVIGRTYDLISALSLSFLCILITNPFCIFNSGFLLSFGAVLGINPFYQTVEKYLEIKNKKIKSWIAGICINTVTRPVIIHAYNEISVYSSVINLIVVALMSAMVICGFFGVFISYIWFDLGKMIFFFGCRILKFYEILCEWFLSLPNAVVIVRSLRIWRIVVYYAVLILVMIFMMCRNRYRQKHQEKVQEKNQDKGESKSQDKIQEKNQDKSQGKIRDKVQNLNQKSLRKKCLQRYVTVGMFQAVLLFCILYQKNDKVEVKMIDVGQGDSIFINNKGKSILFDAGSLSESDITKYTILPFLKANGVKSLDYLIMTHSDIDHAGGITELLNEEYNHKNYVKNLVLPDIGENKKDNLYKEIEKAAKDKKINILYFSEGCYIEQSEMRLYCVWPHKGDASMDKNNLSLVIKMEYGEFTMMFTGDLSYEAEEVILNETKEQGHKIETVDVLKAGHHGSNSSGSQEFLELLIPKVTLISCGRNNNPTTKMIQA